MFIAIVLTSLTFFFLTSLFSDLRLLWRNRGFVPMWYTADSEGRVIFRARLWVPREWEKLSPTEQVTRALAQFKGQGPF